MQTMNRADIEERQIWIFDRWMDGDADSAAEIAARQPREVIDGDGDAASLSSAGSGMIGDRPKMAARWQAFVQGLRR